MAETILSTLIPAIFNQLKSIALNKVARSKEIDSELKKLERSLPQIRALLNDASHKEIHSEFRKQKLNDLKHLAYDIDDILDALATDHLTQESVFTKVRNLILTCCTTTFSSSSTQMYNKLNDLNTKLQPYDDPSSLGLTELIDGRSQHTNRRNEGSLLTPGIVGREGQMESLVQKLLAGHEPKVNQNNFSIVPIVGMGGVGKTTLTRLLYNEPKVEEHFDLKAWVCVSDEFDSFNIGKLIFESVAEEEKKQKEFKNPSVLQEALRKQLYRKRLLLVLDDVWSEKIKDWDTLVPPFHAVAPGSKIIITTRKETLLQQLPYAHPSYHLDKLSHEDAWSLFAHTVGANHFDSYPTLRPLGEGIVKKCDGLPLALKALGSSLGTKTNEEEWKEVLDSEIWTRGGEILPALRLSYLDLTACLKQLFAYTCLFPKDYVFEKEDLIWLWMAEGFLHKSTEGDSIEMERWGVIYFDELLSKSFFECVDNDKSLFVMHDLMNDLATSVAGEFFIRLDIGMKNKIKEHSLKRYRHMSFVREKFMAYKKFEEFESAKSLRTFLAVPVVVRDGWGSFSISKKILVDLLPQLPLLRVLCLSKLEIDEVPESVGDLKHLRYLNLSKTQITHLPEKVCNLSNLQTLIVFGCCELSKLPDSFSKLKNLRHFDIRDTQLLRNMPLWIGELKSLKILSDVVIGGGNEFPISGLKNLKIWHTRVSIHRLDKLQDTVQAREAALSEMRIRELEVGWSDVFDGSRNEVVEKDVLDVLKPRSDILRKLEIWSYGGTEFPKWVGDSVFHQLTDVSIWKCRKCKFLPPLGQLPSLKKLSISSMDEVEKVGAELLGTTELVAFPSLESLYFRHMARWKGWSTNSGVAVFPCLKELCIDCCPDLVEVSVEALPSLRVLSIENCGDGVLTSLVGVASSVTELSIDGISGLSDEVWGGVVQSLGALEKLGIEGCNEIRYMWELEEEACKEVLVNLNKLEIKSCKNLLSIGGAGGKEKDGSNLLTSLRILEIGYCENLEHLNCPNSTEELTIYGCSSITSVSFPTGGGGGWENFAIRSCEKLVRIGGGEKERKRRRTGATS